METSRSYTEGARSASLPLLLLLIVPSVLTFAQDPWPSNFSASFSPGESTKFWISEAGANYTFGFKALTQPGEFLLAIWRTQDPKQMPIWWAAGGEGPALATPGSSFLYNQSSGFLQLQTTPSEALWRSNNSGKVRFLDTGNLQLLNGNASAWETFEDHRNTLSLMSLTARMLRNNPRLLQSTENQTSYANGKFHMATYRSFDVHLFGIDQLHNQYVYMKDYNISINISGPGGHISIGNQLDGSAYTSINPRLERLTLDYDGNLRVYRWTESNATWVAVWALLQDWSLHCRAGSPCGPFGICETDIGQNKNACSCATGYFPISSTDMSRGCSTTRSPPVCGQPDNQSTVMAEQSDADFYYNDLTWFQGVSHIDECKELCLRDCKCIAATFSGITCFLKGNTTMGYLVNGVSNPNGPVLLMKLLKLPADATTPLPRKARHWAGITVVLIVVGIFGCCLVGAGLVVWRKRFLHCVTWCQRGARRNSCEVDLSARPVKFSYQDLVEATDNFSNFLGEGGYGKVYKGLIRDAMSSQNVAIAVKVLKQTPTSEQIQAEVSTLSKIHHVNLVSLHGFCSGGRKGEETLLVFEYMENGPLDRYLSPKHMQEPLPWSTRLSIAVGVARGLAYLHHECNPPILHCDIKPQNVLLDRAFRPKVADFGLAARFGNSAQSHISMSCVRGTVGYIAPDWFQTGSVTPKIDVYSFGMLLMKLVHGIDTLGGDHLCLIEWASETLAAGYVVSPDISDSTSAQQNSENVGEDVESQLAANTQSPEKEQEELEQEQQLRLLGVGLRCVHKLPACRPSMSEVVKWIEGSEHFNDPPLEANMNNDCDSDSRQIEPSCNSPVTPIVYHADSI